MKKVLLFGELGRRFGRSHQFEVKTPAEAVRALCANFPGFHLAMTQSSERGVAYRVRVGKNKLSKADELLDPMGQRSTIMIAPVVMGSKDATTQILVGAAIVAIAFTGVGAVGLVGGATIGSVAFGVGLSLALGGVAQLLAGDQTDNKQKAGNAAQAFDGPVNTSAQGVPIPIVYGRAVVGSVVVSAGLVTEDRSA